LNIHKLTSHFKLILDTVSTRHHLKGS